MAVNYKLGADVGSFKQGMQEAQASLRTLDAALKNNEASLKAGGNAQIYMEQKSKILNDKMLQQKKLADQLKDAMQKMAQNGVSKTSVEYQRLHQQLLQAQTGMNETKVALDGMAESEQEAAKGADQLTQSVNSIGKKISLEQVISGIGSITKAMETAAGKAVQLGENIWTNVMNSAKWADDTQTMALMYGIDLDRFLKIQKLVQNGMDTSVEAILGAQTKLNKNIGTGSDSFYHTLVELGLAFENVGKFGETSFSLVTDNAEEMFWQAGRKIMEMTDVYEKETKAQELFGKSWKELVPLFSEYGSLDEYNKALDSVKTNTEEEVSDLATLMDTVAEMQGKIETLINKGWAALAPSLTAAADALSELLENVIDYLEKPEGQEAMDKMSESISGLFDDLGKIEPESVVNSFTNVFDKIVKGFEWIYEHKDDVIHALEAIVAGWAGLKLTGGVLQVWQLISGLQGFVGAGGAAGSNLGAVGSAAGLGGKAGGGLNFVNKMLTGGTGAAAGVVTVATNGAAVGDYLVNNTRIGQEIRDTGDVIGSAEKVWNEKLNEIKQNAKTFVQDWGNVVQQIWEASYYDEYFQSVGTTANLIKNGANDLSNWIGDIIGNSVTDFVMDTIKDVANAPEAVKQVTNSTPEQNRNAFRTIIDTFLNGMQEGGGGSHGFGVPVEPVLEDDAQETLQEQASKLTVQVGARIVPVSFSGGAGGGGGGKFGYLAFHANGIWDVPFDGYPAILHKGERVTPAREVSSRSYNSNLYVEKMYMNNGQDAEGLASAMAAAQRRRMSGYGS